MFQNNPENHHKYDLNLSRYVFQQRRNPIEEFNALIEGATTEALYDRNICDPQIIDYVCEVNKHTIRVDQLMLNSGQDTRSFNSIFEMYEFARSDKHAPATGCDLTRHVGDLALLYCAYPKTIARIIDNPNVSRNVRVSDLEMVGKLGRSAYWFTLNQGSEWLNDNMAQTIKFIRESFHEISQALAKALPHLSK